MVQAHEHISKGYYKYSQMHHFISVKNYIFVHQGNKKCLLLRFSNDFDHTVDAMAFTVVQMNAVGQILDQTPVELQCMNLAPGGMYTPDQGIIVNDNCNDFKIVINEVFSEHYRYTIRNQTLVTEYLPVPKQALPPVVQPEPEPVEQPSRREFRGYDDDETDESDEKKKEDEKKSVKVRIKKNGRPGRSALLAAVLLLVMIAFSILELLSNWSSV